MTIDVSVHTPFDIYDNKRKEVGCVRYWAGEGDSHANVVPGPRGLNREVWQEQGTSHTCVCVCVCACGRGCVCACLRVCISARQSLSLKSCPKYKKFPMLWMCILVSSMDLLLYCLKLLPDISKGIYTISPL